MRHKVSIIMLIVMGFAIFLYLIFIPQNTVEPEEEKQDYPLINKQFGWTNSQYEEGGDTIIEEPRNDTYFKITFNQDKTFDVITDCNDIRGKYILKEEKEEISFRDFGYVREMACENSQEASFSNALSRVESYSLNNKNLTLKFSDNQGEINLKFETEIIPTKNQDAQNDPSNDQTATTKNTDDEDTDQSAISNINDEEDENTETNTEIQESKWIWQSATTYDGTVNLRPKNPLDFIIEFRKDNTLSSTTDCNIIGGGYSIQDNELTIEDLNITERFCENSQDTQYFTVFAQTIDDNQPMVYNIKNDTLTFTIKDSNGSNVGTFTFKKE